MKRNRTRVRRKATLFVLTIIILAMSAVTALAGSDPGMGVGSFDLEAKYPAGVLNAEDWH